MDKTPARLCLVLIQYIMPLNIMHRNIDCLGEIVSPQLESLNKTVNRGAPTGGDVDEGGGSVHPLFESRSVNFTDGR